MSVVPLKFYVCYDFTYYFIFATAGLFDNVTDPDGKHVVVSVFLGSHGSYHKYIEEGNSPSACVVAALFLSGKTKWDMLDCLIRRAFKVRDH